MYSDLRGHSMYIATRRARLEAREAGFLVTTMDLFGRFLMLFLILPLRTKEMQPNG